MALAEVPLPDELSAQFRDLVAGIYKEHAPEKIDNLPKLCEKYAGTEDKLYSAMCEKYKIQPQDKKTKYQCMVIKLYRDKAPDKIVNLPKVFEKYAGREDELYQAMCEKYGVEPESEGADSHTAAPAAPPAAGVDAALYQRLVTELYQELAPDKLSNLPKLFEKYVGREDELYEAMCKKYSVEPKVPDEGIDSKLYKGLVEELYKEHAPDKLQNMPRLFDKYAGREDQLYAMMCEKYGVTPKAKVPPPDPNTPRLSRSSLASQSSQGPSAFSADLYKALVTELYKEHNPDKVGEVDALFAKKAGKEEELYRKICEKYGVTPKASMEEEKVALYHRFVTELYAEHAPDKVENLSKLFEKYKGKEEELYGSICLKYSVSPKAPVAEAQKEEVDKMQQELTAKKSQVEKEKAEKKAKEAAETEEAEKRRKEAEREEAEKKEKEAVHGKSSSPTAKASNSRASTSPSKAASKEPPKEVPPAPKEAAKEVQASTKSAQLVKPRPPTKEHLDSPKESSHGSLAHSNHDARHEVPRPDSRVNELETELRSMREGALKLTNKIANLEAHQEVELKSVRREFEAAQKDLQDGGASAKLAKEHRVLKQELKEAEQAHMQECREAEHRAEKLRELQNEWAKSADASNAWAATVEVESLQKKLAESTAEVATFLESRKRFQAFDPARKKTGEAEEVDFLEGMKREHFADNPLAVRLEAAFAKEEMLTSKLQHELLQAQQEAKEFRQQVKVLRQESTEMKDANAGLASVALHRQQGYLRCARAAADAEAELDKEWKELDSERRFLHNLGARIRNDLSEALSKAPGYADRFEAILASGGDRYASRRDRMRKIGAGSPSKRGMSSPRNDSPSSADALADSAMPLIAAKYRT